MHPGSVDPRRPEKVQRYKAPSSGNVVNGEDLTPDYMNILGQRATTANAPAEPDKHVVDGVVGGGVIIGNVNLANEPNHQHGDGEVVPVDDTSSSNATNVIPTSPQYGVAIISSNVSIADLPTETVTISTDTVTDSKPAPQQQPSAPTTAAPTITTTTDDGKDLHSTPSRNDRFKVVKIASLEPFKRGRWKCMDYVDEAPPPIAQPSKVTQSAGSIPVQSAGGVYLQTQSLPQQQIQQMLLQSGYTNGTQFFQNVPAQMMPQTQYFYPSGANIPPQQLVNATGVPSSMPAQFINAASQPYFAAGVVQNSGFAIPANYQNVQYVPANLIQNQNSAFVPTSQTVQLPANFQQSQTYAGQPTMVNGHAYNEQHAPQQPQPQQQQVTSTSLPTQPAKSVILNTNVQQPVVSTQPPISQTNLQNQMVQQNSTQSQSVPVIQNQQYQQPPQQNFQTVVNPPSQQPPTNPQNQIPQQQNVQVFDHNQKVVPQQQQPPQQQQLPATFDQNQQQNPVQVVQVDKNQQANNVYTNPQFDMNVNSLTVLENAEPSAENVNEANSGTEVPSENADDPSKTNPVVNAIDNKIEQAMDLVKSHLMYTVREEVEVLKEKIAELMERIQQLETENNFLRSQIPKSSAAAIPPPVAMPILTTSATVVQSTTTTTTSTAPPPNEQQ